MIGSITAGTGAAGGTGHALQGSLRRVDGRLLQDSPTSVRRRVLL
jgi:hypothetical protein